LDSLFVEGLVPIMSLEGDHFTYRENTRQIIGERSGRRYSMGDRVRVVLDRVDPIQRRLQFSILRDASLDRPRGGAKSTHLSGEGLKAKPKQAHHPYKPPKAKALGKKKHKGKGKRRG
jgi:ribonuclease R